MQGTDRTIREGLRGDTPGSIDPLKARSLANERNATPIVDALGTPVATLHLPAADPLASEPTLREAFAAGFLASGEGWNGETLQDGGSQASAIAVGIVRAFDRWLESQ